MEYNKKMKDEGVYWRLYEQDQEHVAACEPSGSLNKEKALDQKPGARTPILPSAALAADPHTTDSRGEQSEYTSLPKQ
jgi:hypothetical protein